jgi:PTS system N-acetylglucosamine-specific IIC component
MFYYGLFRYFIERFNLKTPGREREEGALGPRAGDAQGADGFIAALGGAGNLREVTACTTRLRLTLADRGRVVAGALRRLGASGTVNISDAGLQVVVGPMADQIASDIRARLAAGAGGTAIHADVPAAEVLAALGGARNVARVEVAPGRVLVTLKDGAKADEPALRALCPRGIAMPKSGSVHLLHARPDDLEANLSPLLG